MQKSNKKLSVKWQFAISIILSAFVILYIYTFLHEGGHALVGILSGGKVGKVTLGLNARIWIDGAVYNNLTLSLFNAAGLILPVIALIIALLIYNRKLNNIFYHCIYFISSVGVISTFFTWIIFPLVSLFSQPPMGEDATKFLLSSGINPIIVSVAALLITIIMLVIVIKKGIFKNYMDIVRLFSKKI